MALFGMGAKKEKPLSPTCACQHSAASIPQGNAACCADRTGGICCVKVLGSGCKACHELFVNTKAAVEQMGLQVQVEYITDMEKIMSYGVMSMPALVVNEKVISTGRVLKTADVIHLLGQTVGSAQDSSELE